MSTAMPSTNANTTHRPSQTSATSTTTPTSTSPTASSNKRRMGVRIIPWKMIQTISSSVRKSAKLVKNGRRHRTSRNGLSTRMRQTVLDYHDDRYKDDRYSQSRLVVEEGEEEDGEMMVGELSSLLLSSRLSNRSKSSQSLSAEVENLYTVATTTRPASSYYSDGVQAQVLSNIERVLRFSLIFFGVYLIGWMQSITFLTPDVVWKVLYLIGTAWGTCVIIKVISWVLTYFAMDSSFVVVKQDENGRRFPCRLGGGVDNDGGIVVANKSRSRVANTTRNDDDNTDDEAVSPILRNDELTADYYKSYHSIQESQPSQLQTSLKDSLPQSKRTRPSSNRIEINTLHTGNPSIWMDKKLQDSNMDLDNNECEASNYEVENDDDDDDGDHDMELMSGICDQVLPMPKQHHPELEGVYIMDLLSGERIIAGEPYHLDCEMFYGTLLVMCRTSDADSSKAKLTSDNIGTELNTKYSDYFRTKQRRFEIQLQIKFKKVPPSRLFFHCQVDEPIKLGVVQRAFVAATLNLIEKRNYGGFVFNVPGKEPKPVELLEGRYEKPHITFAAEKAFDRLVVTKDGEVPPTLGTEIYEDPEAMKYRRKHEFLYNTSDTYTFALWSAYGDFTRWKCVNLPAIGPFSFSSIIRDQNFSLHLYYLDAPDGENRHMECYQRRLASFELNHAKYCKMSEARKKWMLRFETASSDNNARNLEMNRSIQILNDTVQIEDASASEELESRVYSSESEDSGSEYDYVADADGQYSYDDDEETRALEELGEGIYLRSGDPVQLREFNSYGMGSILTNGGGFATLQSDNNGTITIEKFRLTPRKIGSANSQSSSLIRNGDVVQLRLIDDSVSSYLTIHKGWWLKWVENPSRNSCLFTIHTNDIEEDVGSDSSSDTIGLETQSSYLRLGGTFRLCSKITSLVVGVRVSDSVKFGGRVLGLYKPGSYYVTEGTANRNETYSIKQMMMPLKLCVYMPSSSDDNVSTELATSYTATSNLSPLSGKIERRVNDFSFDASAWLEVMHRSKRHVFRVYAIRMLCKNRLSTSSDVVDTNSSLRLRTGNELTPLLQFGALHGKQGHILNSPGTDEYHCKNDVSSPIVHNLKVADDLGLDDFRSFAAESNHNSPERPFDHSFSPSSSRDDSDSDGETGLESPHSLSNQKRKRSKTWIRSTTHGITKVAKGVKTGTIKSGHLIGKAVSHKIIHHGINKRRYLREKQKKAKMKVRQKDHHIAVNKALKTAQLSPRLKNKQNTLQIPNGIMAGQLKAPDQSCRTVNYILCTLSSETSSQAKALLCTHLLACSDIDSSFLSGGAMKLGVVVSPTDYKKPGNEFVVARALWDSHWREEVAILCDSSISFYTPLSKKADISIPFYDIQGVRQIDDSTRKCPLTGFPLLAIETAWKCHYIAFRNEDTLNDFSKNVHAQISSHQHGMPKKDEWNARMWQNIQSSTDTSGESAKWASIISSKKRKQRIILNSRRMPFDCEEFSFCDDDEEFQLSLCSFVENLLSTALSFSLENLMKNPSAFVQFLDDTSKLRVLPLRYMDKSDKSSFCIFVNIYHCLLQHSLLLCTGGPPSKVFIKSQHHFSCGTFNISTLIPFLPYYTLQKNVAHFMRTHCYEIGGDIFSLAELESYVIRGNLPKPYYPKAPYGSAPKKSRGHVVYALEYVDPRLPFILHYGNTCHPPDITVLRPSKLEKQLSDLSKRFLQSHIIVDKSKKLLILPKVCDM
eukprot:CAMPEP_0176499580 /NCGR_PEP_ID=MMETSP0200_2-20121128/13008_1 /TAXON_ID=947934 /ORGANISM="Chaetoceros sp., Strain GSL56" /LENGTH=1717 /DNA_ID=CAMNT_0017898019 /DNA_START=64 /DNA_END=5217 /DNA_ORIENTATION=+